ncbi:MAG: hypothetical protein GWN00_01310 [Aliifodinibius sp.]|nr:hypothetical protein [Fodinibius sp.]NIV09970.1 hypothetical protein [Fodinibius sp.]NIY23500.1 hypothetical protein [Fodinibius sp.]
MIRIPLPKFMAFQREFNVPVYTAPNQPNNHLINLEMDLNSTRSVKTSINLHNPAEQSLWVSIKKKVNTPITITDVEYLSHDYTDETTWPTPGDSVYSVSPEEGYKLLVTSIVLRFPKDVKITAENKLTLAMGLWDESQGSIVEIKREYPSLRSLISRVNGIVSSPFTPIIPDAPDATMEVRFTYADQVTAQGSPMIFRSSKLEYIKVFLSGHTVLVNSNNEAYLENPAWVSVLAKKVTEL